MNQLVRTQIYLPVKIKQLLKKEANARNTTLSDILRNFAEIMLEKTAGQQNGFRALLAMASNAQQKNTKGPADLSANHDAYLYQKD